MKGREVALCEPRATTRAGPHVCSPARVVARWAGSPARSRPGGSAARFLCGLLTHAVCLGEPAVRGR
jgi:hypothetical protein